MYNWCAVSAAYALLSFHQLHSFTIAITVTNSPALIHSFRFHDIDATAKIVHFRWTTVKQADDKVNARNKPAAIGKANPMLSSVSHRIASRCQLHRRFRLSVEQIVMIFSCCWSFSEPSRYKFSRNFWPFFSFSLLLLCCFFTSCVHLFLLLPTIKAWDGRLSIRLHE